MKHIFASLICTGLLSLSAFNATAATDTILTPADYVSTLCGSLSDHSFSTGNTYPAIALPWGMNTWTPMTSKTGDGWAYKYQEHFITGFKQTHQPSPWINDYAQFIIMPLRDIAMHPENKRASAFSHKAETAKPYYYSVYLPDHDLTVEITPTERAAVIRITYPESTTSGFVVDAFSANATLSSKDGVITGTTDNNHGGVPQNFTNYFIVKSSKAFSSFKTVGDEAVAGFKSTARGEQVTLYVASSFISASQAEINLREVEGLSFDEVCSAAKDRWNEVLGRIEIEGGTLEQMKTFYSCLYRATMFPRKFHEIDENGHILHYSPYDGKVHKGTMYTDNGYWDVFRALFPLVNLVYPEMGTEMLESFAHVAEENEFLPEWASPGHRQCMIGNNSASIVADGILKGLSNLSPEETQTLYNTILYGTEHVHPTVKSSGRLGHEFYNSIGYVPCDTGIKESVARTLEYSYNDWCIMKMAEKLGRPEKEVLTFAERAQNYRNVFDKETSLMRGRLKDGSFETPFSPYKWGGVFTEGNAWHYTWSVFHDVEGLVDLMGGRGNFTKMLDSLFVVPPIYDDSYYGSRIHEITEMQVAAMGNYAHGNQPAQHVIYLYDYALQPWKAQEWARRVMDQLYSSTPDAYCGDEDNGQTSAWYIFSALGFYPVCPASGNYMLGSPLFKHATVHLRNGKDIVIDAPDNSAGTPYVQSMKLNGRNYTRNFVTYEDLIGGARISVRMSDKPNTGRGVTPDSLPARD